MPSLFAAALLSSAVAPTVVMGQSKSANGTAPNAVKTALVRANLQCRADACAVVVPTEDVPFVQWVRDRADAEVLVLITEQGAGSTGTVVTVVVTDIARPASRADTVTLSLVPGAAAASIRSALSQLLRLSLASSAVSRGTQGLDIAFAHETEAARDSSARDRWRRWTITVGGSTQVDAQEQSRLSSGNIGAVANRVTSTWRLSVGGGMSETSTSAELSNNVRFRSRNRSDNYAVFGVRSVGDHWAIGGRVGTTRSEYLNQQRVWRVAGAAEYDVFPYAVATHRQLTIRYQLGLNRYAYLDTTMFGVLHEARPNQSVVLAYARQAAVGSIDADFTAANFITTPSLYSMLLEVHGSLNVARGLALTIAATANRVHDQIYLRRSGATDGEILVGQRALSTNYQTTVAVGLAFTFGSIYNSVVNARFAGLGVSTSGRVPVSGF